MKPTTAAIGAIVFAWMIFSWHWLSGADVIPFDSKLTYFQLTSWAVDCYRHGILPLWDPYFMAGFPSCADPQIHCFYLFATPFFALLGPLQPVWFDRIALCHILAAGVGFYFLAREFRLTPNAAAITAIVVMFGGSASARLQHTGMIYAYGLLPWCLLLTRFVCTRSNIWYVVALGICAGSLGILGDQVAFLSCLTVAAFAAAELSAQLRQKESIKTPMLPPIMRLAFAALITIIVMLPQMIPTAELLPLSSRPWIPLQNLAPKSLYRWSFITYLIPDIFRTFDGYANYIGKNDPSETYLYAGLLPATILLYGGIYRRRLFRKESLGFVLPLTFFVLYALGTQTPAYAAFWHLIPGVKSFQRPTDATFLLNVFLALLVGWILDQLRATRASGTQTATILWTRSFAFAGLFSSLFATAIILLCKYKVPHVLMQNNIGAFWKIGIFMLVGVVLLQLLERSRNRGTQNILITLIAVISFFDIQFANSRNFLNTAVTAEYAFDDPSRLNEFPALLALSRLKSKPNAPYRIEMLGSEKEMQWWNASNHLNVQVTDGMWPINLLSYHQYSGACNPLFGRRFNHWMSGFNSPLFDLLNVKYVLTNMSPDTAHGVLGPDKFTSTAVLNQYTVYENHKCLPRSFLVSHCKTCHTFSELADTIKNVRFQPATEVVLLSEDITHTDSDAAILNELSKEKDGEHENSSHDSCTWINYGQNELTLAVHCDNDRLLFLGDIYYPGWCAEVDGVTTKIYRADYLFRTIIVRKGDHQVRFKFKPFSLEALKESQRLAKTQ